MKVSFSLQKSLFEKVDDLARELQISRSRLFVLAVEDFIRRHENRRLLKDLNAACDDAPDPEEQALRQNMRSQHRQMVQGLFLQTARSLNLKGPADWSANLEEYLYGEAEHE